jgi:hypothetical protein
MCPRAHREAWSSRHCPAQEVERFFVDEAERETGLLAEFEAVLAKARPPGRPNKILRDLIIMMYVTVELPDRDSGPSSRSTIKHSRT